jgi:zinc ribbon protein
MFCPKCAAQNLDGASFCRVCGANISLVPQALTGQLQQAVEPVTRSDRKMRRREATLDNAFRNVFMGIAFLLVTMALAFSAVGRTWWFWMLIPAFSMMGTGIAQYIRFREQQNRSMLGHQPATPQQVQASLNTTAFPIRSTGELMATPPSVTENTTRHLGVEAPTKHFDPAEPTK